VSRGDPTFAKIDVDVLTSHKLARLKVPDRYVYFCLWILAVKERTDFLDLEQFSYRFVANLLQIDNRLAAKAVQNCCKNALLELIKHRGKMYVFVPWVRACHRQLKWDRRPEWVKNGDLIGDGIGPLRDSESPDERDITVSGAEIVTQGVTPEGAPEDGQTVRPDPDPPASSSELLGEEDTEPWNQAR